MSSPAAFLSGAPIRERGDMQPMCVEYKDPHWTLYVKAKSLAEAKDIVVQYLDDEFYELGEVHTFCVLNELPLGCSYINES